MKRIYLLLSALGLIGGITATAQITVTDNQTADALANALVGEGVTISNAALNCDGVANGLFQGTCNLGIDTGIILTSGTAAGVIGPNNGGFDAGPDDGDFSLPPGDPDLDDILPNTVSHDACVLEFDFRPSGDTVKFDYVFASTEYQRYSCSSFNDVFGFLISGPGYATPYNIATIPGHPDIPICVNSTTDPELVEEVNDLPSGYFDVPTCNEMGTGSPFSEYYVNNMDGATIAYGGFTRKFTARAQVVPCELYHLKLAIADGTDASLDSGVFLKAGSLSSPVVSSTSESGQGVETPYTSTVRGCPPAKIFVNRGGSTTVPLTIHYDIQGNAVNGYDYTQIPDSVTIPAGQSEATINIQGLIVDPAEGPKQVILNIFSPFLCNGTSDSIIARDTVTIFDSLKVNITQPDTAICLGASVDLTAEGETYYSYQWTPANTVSNPTSPSVTVTPVEPTEYIVQAWIQGVVCPPATDHVFINVEAGPHLDLGPDKTLCVGDTVYLYASATPTTNTYTYEWHPGTHLNDSTSDIAIYNSHLPGTETLVATATTPVGCKATDSINVTVNSSSFIRNMIADTGICPGTVFQYDLTGADSFKWVPAFGLSDAHAGNPVVTAHNSTDYTVYGYLKGCIDSQTLHVEVHPEAVISLPDSVRIWPGESYQLDPQGNCLYYQWFPPSGLSAVNISNPLASPEVRTRYFVSGQTENGCEANDSIDVLVETESLLDAPNAFTPGNGPNNVFKVVRRGTATLKVFAVYDRWGNKVFETNDIDKGWDGTYNGQPQPMGVYVYRIEAVTATGKPFTKNGNVTLVR